MIKLNVLTSPKGKEPWFADGLQFSCSQCGNCCTGSPGFVWISREEIARVADYLKISRGEVVRKFCRKVGRRISLKESRHPQHGGYDCIFIKEVPVDADKSEETVVHTRRICSIYPVRPLQCRTWPFWEGNLANPKAWDSASRKCPGMNTGKLFDREKIQQLRDAHDWPENPPTSAQPAKPV